jgi:hypothetical protein
MLPCFDEGPVPDMIARQHILLFSFSTMLVCSNLVKTFVSRHFNIRSSQALNSSRSRFKAVARGTRGFANRKWSVAAPAAERRRVVASQLTPAAPISSVAFPADESTQLAIDSAILDDDDGCKVTPSCPQRLIFSRPLSLRKLPLSDLQVLLVANAQVSGETSLRLLTHRRLQLSTLQLLHTNSANRLVQCGRFSRPVR